MAKQKEHIDIGSPVKNFVNQTIKEIAEGLPKGYALTSNVNFELSVVNQKSGKGKIDLRVLSLGGDVSTQNAQKVSFSVGNPKQGEQQVKKFIQILKEAGEEIDKPKKKAAKGRKIHGKH